MSTEAGVEKPDGQRLKVSKPLLEKAGDNVSLPHQIVWLVGFLKELASG